jgi:hypothetical protein
MFLLCLGLGLAPIVVWNAQHGWVGAGQLADRVGLSSRAQWASFWPVLSFLGGEAGALGGVWWVAGIAALVDAFARVARRSGSSPSVAPGRFEKASTVERHGLLYLLCLWGVIWTACLAASLLGETEVNWMAPGYMSLVILIGIRAERVFARGGAKARSYAAAWCLTVSAIIAIHHTEWFYPMVASRVPAPTNRWAAPLRLYDPTARMRGHQVLAREVESRLKTLEARGTSPAVVTPTYGLASTLSFYLPDQPETYCLSWNFGMTPQPVNQHDLWHPNPRHDPEAFRGRPIVVVDDANMPPSYAYNNLVKGVVGSMESTERIVVRERGVIVGTWDIAICHDYRGLAGYKQNPLVRR